MFSVEQTTQTSKRVFTLLLLLLSITINLKAQTSIHGKWQISRYIIGATFSGKSEKIDTLSKEEFFYEFKEDKTFTADGWINPFRGSLNHNKIKGTYLIQNNELKLIYLGEEDKFNSNFYFDYVLDKYALILSFDKVKLIKWYKNSKNPDDSYALKLSQSMFTAVEGKMYFKRVK
ncbi:hypothetical protein [Flectobacillus rivi]|uniref:Lipocalin-like domain-containing protein n=1 Tax=Flectobacillus rivi TaxID=2984209 RepID=A0ABT6Z5M9_9BACT|nr:hypothetical protein [Flectobacillus rivi]MDI9876441.1 hypothetical protein [Flectobacillus rivi]